MNLKELIAFYESKLENHDLTSGSRKVATLTLMELRRTERLNELVTELESQNTEMYVDLAGGVDYTVDTLIRHKWPEEKPEEDPEKKNEYLLWGGEFEQAHYHPDGYFHNFVGGCAYEFGDEVVYWWNLPEVTE